MADLAYFGSMLGVRNACAGADFTSDIDTTNRLELELDGQVSAFKKLEQGYQDVFKSRES